MSRETTTTYWCDFDNINVAKHKASFLIKTDRTVLEGDPTHQEACTKHFPALVQGLLRKDPKAIVSVSLLNGATNAVFPKRVARKGGSGRYGSGPVVGECQDCPKTFTSRSGVHYHLNSTNHTVKLVDPVEVPTAV